MADKVRIGLIGYGKVADLHADAVAVSAGGQLVSVCGRNTARRNDFAAKWKISSRENVEEMVRQDNIDAVIITTPHPQHCEGALEAFAAGAHVLVEKPMALTEEECNKMIAASQTAGKLLSVVCQRRWFPACARIKNAIDEGKIGKPVRISVVTGNVFEALSDIDGISDKVDMHSFVGGGCGKMGQWPLPVGFGGPYIRVKNMQVQ